MNLFEKACVGFTVFGLVAFVGSVVGILALPAPLGAGLIILGCLSLPWPIGLGLIILGCLA